MRDILKFAARMLASIFRKGCQRCHRLSIGEISPTRVLTRTMRRGERLVARLQRVGDRELPDKLARDVENWSESTAFFVNFILNGDADDQLLILGFDPRWHEPVDNRVRGMRIVFT